jgi:uncharacterized protein
MKPAYLYCIPFEGKYLIYRPLLHCAFIGNEAMAGLARRSLDDPLAPVTEEQREARDFLEQIGFLAPNPPPPAKPSCNYAPRTVVLLLTNRCNLRCTYCYADAGCRPAADMPLELATRAVGIGAENARRTGHESFELIFHGGGEPTVHWDVFKASVERAESSGLQCSISMSSNGMWSARQRRFILEHFKGVSLSFDGMREVQDAQRPTAGGGSSFATVMKTIREMDRKGFAYNIRMTACPLRLEELPESVRFIFSETGCRSVQIEPAFGEGREGWRNPDEETADRFIAALIESLDVAEEYQRDLLYSGARPWLTLCGFCSAAEEALVVRADGSLVACYEITDPRHELADYFTVGRIGDDGPEIFEQARSRLTRMREERLALCEECFCIWHCGGDCSSRTFTADGGGHLRFEQRCRINREISKEVLARYIERSGGLWRAKIEVKDEQDECEACDGCRPAGAESEARKDGR